MGIGVSHSTRGGGAAFSGFGEHIRSAQDYANDFVPTLFSPNPAVGIPWGDFSPFRRSFLKH